MTRKRIQSILPVEISSSGLFLLVVGEAFEEFIWNLGLDCPGSNKQYPFMRSGNIQWDLQGIGFWNRWNLEAGALGFFFRGRALGGLAEQQECWMCVCV